MKEPDTKNAGRQKYRRRIKRAQITPYRLHGTHDSLMRPHGKYTSLFFYSLSNVYHTTELYR